MKEAVLRLWQGPDPNNYLTIIRHHQFYSFDTAYLHKLGTIFTLPS